jgi:glycosyltransferase involved in cell wall biosynthesis
MVSVSAVLIVKNEEAVLDTCLMSLQGLDEIIVLDTGSTDKTCEIARKYTDKVYEGVYEWNDNFAEARNKALSYCTGDWILSIDADERLEEGGVDKIREAVKHGRYAINVWMDGGECSFQFPRLLRVDPKVYWKGAIHNYPSVIADYSSDVRISYGYSPAHKKDSNRALRILAKEVKAGKGPREIFYLAREYMYRRDWASAVYYYDMYLQRAVWVPEMAEAALRRGEAYWNLGNLKRAQESVVDAIRLNPQFKEAILFMSRITGPKNSKRWKEFASTANNDGVLFVRD